MTFSLPLPTWSLELPIDLRQELQIYPVFLKVHTLSFLRYAFLSHPFFVAKLILRKTNTTLYNHREMMVTMVPMEVAVNRYCNYVHMITDVGKFASPYLLY